MPPSYIKRIAGPATSFTPSKFVEENEREVKPISERRANDRKSQDFRPFYLKVGVVSQAKGSAYIEMGQTKLLCSVYGPRETKKNIGFSITGQLHCEFKYAPFSCAVRRQSQQDPEEKELSQILKQTFEPVVCLHRFPKARVDINVLILNNDGGALSGSITAVGAALADAGIPMFDLIVGCSLVCIDDNLLIDPTFEEENYARNHCSSSQGTIVLGLMPSIQQVTCLLQDGVIQKHTAIQGLNLLNDCCNQIKVLVEQILLKSWKKESKEK